jgi:hypothetical protein
MGIEKTFKMEKSLKNNKGLVFYQALLGFLIALALGILFLFVLTRHPKTINNSNASSQNTTSSASTSSTDLYATLSPATVPSKVPECNQQITFESTGNPAPITCANGYLNTQAWSALATLEPSVLTLGYNATSSQVQSALCADYEAGKSDANTNDFNVIEGSAYQIATLYYGWNFSTNPAKVLSNGIC